MPLSFTPDKAGTFTFLCDVFCGDGHEGMSGRLVVTWKVTVAYRCAWQLPGRAGSLTGRR
jgi:heme/copper-type cytochrome/quinol oxidase subunit 2